MAQDAHRTDGLDMVPVYSSSTHAAELEADNIHALLDANGISNIIIGPSVLPVVEFQVQVPRAQLEEARKVIDEAEAAGSEAATEAEKESESAE